MKKRYTAGLLAAALVLSLGGTAVLAEQIEQEQQPEQPVQQEVLDVGQDSAPSQDAPAAPEQPQEGTEQTEQTAVPAGTLTWEQLEEEIRSKDLTVLILKENIASAQATDFEKLKDDLRDQLNSIANQQWKLHGSGGSSGGTDYSQLFTDAAGATAQDKYLYGAVNAIQTGMGAMSTMMTSSTTQTLQNAYDAVREQFDALKDGETQKTVADSIRMLENMVDSEVKLAQATYAQLVELDAALTTLDRSLAALDRQVEELELRYELGQISSLTLAQVKAGRNSLASQRDSYASQARSGLMALEFMTGRELTGTLKLSGLPAVNAQSLTAMDLEKDMAAAREKSWNLYDARLTLDDAKEALEDAQDEYEKKDFQYTQAEHTWQAAQYTYEATVRGFEMTFRGLYDQVKDAQQVLAAAQTSLAVQQDLYAAQKLKYEQGSLSDNGLKDAGDELASAQDTVDSAARSLFTAYNNYRWAVEYGITD